MKQLLSCWKRCAEPDITPVKLFPFPQLLPQPFTRLCETIFVPLPASASHSWQNRKQLSLFNHYISLQITALGLIHSTLVLYKSANPCNNNTNFLFLFLFYKYSYIKKTSCTIGIISSALYGVVLQQMWFWLLTKILLCEDKKKKMCTLLSLQK